ncbi:MAG: DUF2249 domain-containing protein [Nostocoides sp.]
MTTVAISSTEADAQAAAAVEQHHAQMSGTLSLLVDVVLGVAEGRAAADRWGWGDDVARGRLVQWCRDDLLPHALAEEPTLYAAASEITEGRLLVGSMLAEHRVIGELVDDIERATTAVAAAAHAVALRVLFDSHLDKENTLILPLLVSDPLVSVAALLEGLHEIVGGDERPAEQAAACTACGETDGPDHPELDARAIPHAIRHATIFGALDAVRPGCGLVLVAPHDPKPLLAQLERRTPGGFDVQYLQRGPDAWRLAFVRHSD